MRGGIAIPIMLVLIFPLLVGTVFGGGDSEEDGQYKASPSVYADMLNTRSAAYKDLEECLKDIRENTGSTLDIVTDKPSEITGFLSNGEHFGCVERVKDEKVTHIDGWYTINLFHSK